MWHAFRSLTAAQQGLHCVDITHRLMIELTIANPTPIDWPLSEILLVSDDCSRPVLHVAPMIASRLTDAANVEASAQDCATVGHRGVAHHAGVGAEVGARHAESDVGTDNDNHFSDSKGSIEKNEGYDAQQWA